MHATQGKLSNHGIKQHENFPEIKIHALPCHVGPVETVHFSPFASIFTVPKPKIFMHMAIASRIHGNGPIISSKKKKSSLITEL